MGSQLHLFGVLLVAILSLVMGELDATDLEKFWDDLYANNGSVRKEERAETTQPLVTTKILAKSKPDECFLGIGEDNIYPFDPDTETCPAEGQLKHNEVYVWSLVAANNKLWFGTAPNLLCIVVGAAIAINEVGAPLLPYADDGRIVCEFGSSKMNSDLDPLSGDWRPPSVYVYDISTGVTEKQEFNDDVLKETMGFRSAGALNDVVLMAGPGVTGIGGPSSSQGIGMCAFNSVSGDFLGCRRLLEYDNIRKFVSVGGSLYTGVRVHPVDENTPFGAVLKWTGNVSSPFEFETVGYLDGEAVELVEHDNRLFTSTWPDLSKANKTLEEGQSYGYAGLWMSPLLGENGLTKTDSGSWSKVWNAFDYETDEITARTYNGGALASFKGYLYWGSLHIPFGGAFNHASFYNLTQEWRFGLPNIPAFSEALLATNRPNSIFRGRYFGTESQETEVLYGLQRMPTFVDGAWELLPNKMGEPRYGRAGFGNIFNSYTWAMTVHKESLYVGTLDLSQVYSSVLIPFFAQTFVNPFPSFEIPGTTYGADLFALDEDGRATLVDAGGLGNYGSYGIRTMLSLDDSFFIGTATPMNLMTRDGDPQGGWELIQLTDRLECTGKASRLVDILGIRKCYTGRCPRGGCRVALYEDLNCCVFDSNNDGDVDFRDVLSLLFPWV